MGIRHQVNIETHQRGESQKQQQMDYINGRLGLFLAMLMPIVALGLQWTFWQYISPFVWFLFFPAVFFSARLGRFIGGIASTVLSTFLAIYFFMPPQLSWELKNPNNWYSVAMFLIMGYLFSDVQERFRTANLRTRAALQETRAANEKITQLYEKMRELDELKSQFFANVNHELRTPLTLILGPVKKALQSPRLDLEMRHDLEVVERNALFLRRHVNDLLDVSKLDAGRMTIYYTQVDLAQLTRMIASQFSGIAQERNIRFIVDTPPSMSAQVDTEKYQRILLNLLSNSFKFTPNGGEISVALESDAEAAVIQVCDNGPGIPADKHQIVFERFRQLAGSATRSHGGTGLGLSIVKEFVDLHHGEVKVTDAPLKGVMFTIRLPLLAPADSVVDSTAVEVNHEIGQQLVDELFMEHVSIRQGIETASQKDAELILVVEDNPDMNEFICGTLAKYYRVSSAADGQAGLEKAILLKPDLILTDMMMPIMSGSQMTLAIRQQVELKDVPVVMLTASADENLRVRMLQERVQEYINKPFTVEELLARVDNLLTERRLAKEALRKSEKRYQTLVENSPYCIHEIDLDGRLTSMNPSGLKMMGLHVESEIYGTPYLNAVSAEDKARIQGLLELAIQGQSSEFEFRADNGLFFQSSFVPIKDADGKVISLMGLTQNITERKQAEVELISSQQFTQATIDALPFHICVMDENGSILSVNRAWREFAENNPPYPQDFWQGANYLDICDHANGNGANDAKSMAEGIRSVLHGELKEFRLKYPCHSADEERWFVARVTLFTTAGEMRLVMTHENVTQHELAEKALYQSEIQNTRILETTMDGFWLVDAVTQRLVGVNDAYCLMSGYRREELLQMTILQLEVVEQSADIAAHLELLKSRGADRFETTHRRKDGSLLPLDISVQYMAETNKTFAFLRDMTGYKQVENALRETQKDTQILLNTMSEGVALNEIIYDEQGEMVDYRILMVNPAFYNTADYQGAEVVGNMATKLYGMPTSMIKDFWKTHKINNEVQHTEMYSPLNNKSFYISTSPFVDNKFVTSFFDITERKAAEDALRKSESQFRDIINLSPVPYALNDEKQNITYLNAAFTRAFGYDRNDIHTLADWWPKAYPNPEYRNWVAETWQARLDKVKAEGGVFEPLELSIRCKDGSTKTVLAGAGSLGEAYEGIHLVILYDISDRKQAELQIEEQLKRLKALHTIDAVIKSSIDLPTTLEILLEQVTNQLKVDAVSLLLFNKNTLTLEYAYSHGFHSTIIQHTILAAGEGYAGRVILEGKTINIPDITEMENKFSKTYLRNVENFVTYIGVPLIAKGQAVGVLEIFHRSLLQPDYDWLDFLENIADQAAIAINNMQLFDNLQRSNFELTLAYDATINGWSQAMDLRDRETEGHTQRVTSMTVKLAQQMGIREADILHIRRGALLHDIGKLGVPDQILFKAGSLTDDEWKIMRAHPVNARKMLEPIAYLKPALDIPYHHHEKWNGSGYPLGLKGEEIPLAARIFAVVDVWDALNSDRSYRTAWPMEKTRAYIREQAGLHFDPQVVDIFLNLIRDGK